MGVAVGGASAFILEEEDFVGCMNAGRLPPFLGELLLFDVLPVDLLDPNSGLGGVERKLAERSARGFDEAAERGVVRLVPPARLLPEFDRERFSLELPESPRFTLTEEFGVDPGDLRSDPLEPLLFLPLLSVVVRERTCAGARGRLVLLLLLVIRAEDFGPGMGPRLKEPSLDCLLREPVERVESARERGRVGVIPPEL